MQVRWKVFKFWEEWMYTICLESVPYLIFIFNIYHYLSQKGFKRLSQLLSTRMILCDY